MKNEGTGRRAKLPLPAFALVTALSVTALGSAVTGFGMNVWVYETTGSYALFATLAIVSALPALFLAPVAGVIVDRVPRRKVLLACEIVGAIVLLATAVVSLQGWLSPLLIGVLWIFMSIANTFVWPAMGAAITELTTPDQRGRVNGVTETLMGIVTVGSPLLGAVMYKLIGVSGIALFDLVSYVLCIVLLLVVRFPTDVADDGAPAPGVSLFAEFWTDLKAGYAWVAKRRDLLQLLLFFVVINIGSSVFTVLYSPYILSFSQPQTLGVLLSLVGAGTIAGGILFSITGGPSRKELGIVVGALLSGTCMLIFGFARNEWLLYVAALAYGAAIPLVNASSQTVWQAQVPVEMQGRVFSLRRMIAWSFNPVSILLSIPLAHYLFAPLVADAASPVARFWGDGEVGALGLMASACGLLCACTAAVTLLSGGLKVSPATAEPLSAS